MGIAIQNICKNHIIHPDCRERFLPLAAPGAEALRTAGVCMAGISELRRAYAIGRPDPDFHLVLYTGGGCGRLSLPGGTRYLRSGDLLVMPAHTPYAYTLGARVWRMVWFHLHAVPKWSALRLGDWTLRRGYYLEPLRRAAEGILFEAPRAEPEARAALRRQAELAALYIERELSAGYRTQDPEILQRLYALWDRVDARLPHPWTAAELARELHVSTAHLHRLCVKHHGLPPLRMVCRLRMQRAEELLRRTAYPLKQIAALAGYENVFAFSTAFKRHARLSPRAFRRALRPPERANP